MNVKFNGKYFQSMHRERFWLEVPRNQHTEDYALWWRTKHSDNDDYFGYIINENGTVSTKKNSSLVLGYGIAPNREHWKDLSNHMGWKDWMKIEGFTTTKEMVKKPMGSMLQVVGEADRWMEIPYADMQLNNFAWLRTMHGGDPKHFEYSFNQDGTISPKSRPDLVWALGDPSKCHRFRDIIANHLGWKTSREEDRKKQATQQAMI